MRAQELLDTLARGEDSRHQFKQALNNLDSLATELVAMSNSGGERISEKPIFLS